MKKFQSVIQLINNEKGTYIGDLRAYFRHMWKSENVDRPYHNIRHMLHVLWHTHRGLITYPEISPAEIRIALIAAIFHDDKHPGKIGNDSDNIAVAIKSLQENILPEDKDYEEQIILCIQATQFPHIEADFPLYAKLLRDVDVASTLNDVWVQNVLFGLGREFGKTPEEMLKMQLSFLPQLKFETRWAKNEYGKRVRSRIEEVKAMIECLKI